MFILFFLLFITLSLGLFFSVIRTGKFKIWAKVFRIFAVSFSVLVFGYFFTLRSLGPFLENSLAVQVVNKLPFLLDFYIIKVNDDKDATSRYKTMHVGNIRNNHYRIDYLEMQHSNEFWVIGFLGKKDMVYFSQHSIPNKNEDKIIEVKNYINQSAKLSEIAKNEISKMKLKNMRTSIWITLDFIFLFLNIILLLRKPKYKNPE